MSAQLLNLFENPNKAILINPQKEQRLRGKAGTQVIIPANAFDVPEGTEVAVQITEVFEPSDMILQSLSTSSDGKQLITGGMMKVDAWANGQPVGLRRGKTLRVMVPSKNPNPRMQLFTMQQQAGGLINWVQPEPLNQVEETVTINIPIPNRNIIVHDEEEAPQARVMPKKPAPVDYTKLHQLDSVYQAFRKETGRSGEKSMTTFFKRLFNSKDFKDRNRFHFRALQKEKQLVRAKEQKHKNYHKDSLAYLQYLADYQNWEDKFSTTKAMNYVESCFFNHPSNYIINAIKTGRNLDNFDYVEQKQLYYPQLKKLLYSYAANRDSILAAFAIQNGEIRILNAIRNKAIHAQCMQELFRSRSLKEAYRIAFSDNADLLDSILIQNALQKGQVYALTFVQSHDLRQKAYCDLFGVETIKEVATKLRTAYNSTFRDAMGRPDYSYKELPIFARTPSEWGGDSGYAFNLSNLGRFINCDYFPRASKKPLLAKCEAKIPMPPSRTKTFMVFKKHKTIMPSYVNGALAPNACFFKNIPEREPVEIISFYMDDNGQPHVAIQAMEAAEKLPKLNYKSMTLEEFRNKLMAINT